MVSYLNMDVRDFNSIKGGVAQMVERSLRMREARGSIPCTSIVNCFKDSCFFHKDTPHSIKASYLKSETIWTYVMGSCVESDVVWTRI